jgi:hypothetical protein
VPEGPFLCPLDRYRDRRPAVDAGTWLSCLVLEAHHMFASPSSAFGIADGREAALGKIVASGFATPETVRRLYLYRLATGRKADRAPHRLVAEPGPENLNADFWRRAPIYG